MPEIIALARAQMQAGTRAFGPLSLPLDVQRIRVRLDRAAWSATVAVGWSLELSLDGGATWRPWGGATATGASTTMNPLTGLPNSESWFEVTLPESANPARQLRGTLTLSERTRLGVTLTVT